MEKLKDKEIQEKLKLIFVDDSSVTPSTSTLEMVSIKELTGLKYDFNTVEDPEQFIKSLLEENLGLVENPSSKKCLEKSPS